MHSAKEVEYTTTGFRAKNKDEIGKELEKCIISSTNPDIVSIWKGLLAGETDEALDARRVSKTGKGDKSLGAKFRVQMKELMVELQKCDVHFVRCIKPNELKKKDFFLSKYAMQQIRYMGVLESVRIRKEGYPIRLE